MQTIIAIWGTVIIFLFIQTNVIKKMCNILLKNIMLDHKAQIGATLASTNQLLHICMLAGASLRDIMPKHK